MLVPSAPCLGGAPVSPEILPAKTRTEFFPTLPVWCHASCLRCLACMLSPSPRFFGFPFAAPGASRQRAPPPYQMLAWLKRLLCTLLGLTWMYFTLPVWCHASCLRCFVSMLSQSPRFFVFAVAALGRATSGPHPLSNFSLAKAASVDFAWLGFGVLCFACLVPPFMSLLFGFYASPQSSLCMFFCCCIRAGRQRAPPPIKC